MKSYVMETLATDENFNEQDYLAKNADVARAVREGKLASGKLHFHVFGKKEERKIRRSKGIKELKQKKLQKIKKTLRKDLPWKECDGYFDFLSEDLKRKCNIVATEAVSSHGYDNHAMRIIEKYSDGLILDCGAGKRPVYFDNVVNFEIVAYDTTDVLGVGETLPFKDNTFDAVISIAVLEHVKDPFRCAQEIARVLKPGGELYCCVPFLQPLHGYPHHYYNMSHQGLQNLFDSYLAIDNVDVPSSILPIWSLTWIIKSWANGLSDTTREKFLKMQLSDFLDNGAKYLTRDFVKELSKEKNFELASGCAIFAHKPLELKQK
jgi:SAM-dependent methyltransferase